MPIEQSTTPRAIEGITISEEEVRRILRLVVPSHRLVSFSPLKNGDSFNNRLYFLTIEPSSNPSVSPSKPLSSPRLVLKLSGRFWNHTKIQNEVGSICLLKSLAPEIPTPEIIAWSEDGTSIATLAQPEPDSTTLRGPQLIGDEQQHTHTGWILMTCLPGTALSNIEVDENHMIVIARQLADYVALWRESLPPTKYCGNIGWSPAGCAGQDQVQTSN
jgi:hypothetical protein